MERQAREKLARSRSQDGSENIVIPTKRGRQAENSHSPRRHGLSLRDSNALSPILDRVAKFTGYDRDDLDETTEVEEEGVAPESDTDEIPAPLGIIKSLALVNFMCHENFAIELGPKINFIIGQNGSKLGGRNTLNQVQLTQ